MYLEQHNWKTAEENLKQALAKCEELDLPWEKGKTLYCLGLLYRRRAEQAVGAGLAPALPLPPALPLQWRAHLQPRLRLVGDGVLRPQLERIVADLGIQNSVEFLGLRKDVPELLQQSWGFVCPSRWESLPNALLEAMACGLPCVATRVSGSEDIIIDGINGLMVEPEQAAEMATALRRILEDSDLAQRLGLMARATIIPDYQLTTVVKRFTELYRQLITYEAPPETTTSWGTLAGARSTPRRNDE